MTFVYHLFIVSCKFIYEIRREGKERIQNHRCIETNQLNYLLQFSTETNPNKMIFPVRDSFLFYRKHPILCRNLNGNLFILPERSMQRKYSGGCSREHFKYRESKRMLSTLGSCPLSFSLTWNVEGCLVILYLRVSRYTDFKLPSLDCFH